MVRSLHLRSSRFCPFRVCIFFSPPFSFFLSCSVFSSLFLKMASYSALDTVLLSPTHCFPNCDFLCSTPLYPCSCFYFLCTHFLLVLCSFPLSLLFLSFFRRNRPLAFFGHSPFDQWIPFRLFRHPSSSPSMFSSPPLFLLFRLLAFSVFPVP